MRLPLFIFFILLIFSTRSVGQVQGVFVERYYVSDALDSSDITSGGLPVGSVTYRVYIDLADTSKLVRIYGAGGRPLQFRSTAPFFNHLTSGVVHPYPLQPINYQEFTVGLDSWITLGQIARKNANTFCGVTKDKDNNGNYFAGTANDGGMLSNTDPTAGIPLTQSDGMDTMRTPISLSSWGSVGFPDTSVFGPLSTDTVFSSEIAGLQCDGARGNDTSNLVLVAQLTTAGELAFDLNVDVLEYHTTGPEVVTYAYQLAPGEVESATLKVSTLLSYPPTCGCTDARYVEFGDFACSNPDSCRQLVVFGCTDTAACNYDPAANFNIPSLCCYPGYCNDRDLSVVCPQLNLGREGVQHLDLYPNPVQQELIVQWQGHIQGMTEVEIHAMTGQTIISRHFEPESDGGRIVLDVSSLSSGIYTMRLIHGELMLNRLFIKR